MAFPEGDFLIFREIASKREFIRIFTIRLVRIPRNGFLPSLAPADFPRSIAPRISVHRSHMVCPDSSVYWVAERCCTVSLFHATLSGMGSFQPHVPGSQPIAARGA